MNPLDSALARARLLGALAYVGKQRDDRGSRYPWTVGLGPRREWGGFFYSVTADAIYRNSPWGMERMR